MSNFSTTPCKVPARYISKTIHRSKTIQNELLIEVVGNSIPDDTLQEVKRAKYYSVIANDVADMLNKEQLSLTVRYVLDGTVKEMFVDFIKV